MADFLEINENEKTEANGFCTLSRGKETLLWRNIERFVMIAICMGVEALVIWIEYQRTNRERT